MGRTCLELGWQRGLRDRAARAKERGVSERAPVLRAPGRRVGQAAVHAALRQAVVRAPAERMPADGFARCRDCQGGRCAGVHHTTAAGSAHGQQGQSGTRVARLLLTIAMDPAPQSQVVLSGLRLPLHFAAHGSAARCTGRQRQAALSSGFRVQGNRVAPVLAVRAARQRRHGALVAGARSSHQAGLRVQG